MVSGSLWILWLHLLAAAAWLGGDAILLGAILPNLAEEGSTAAVRRAHFLTSRAMEVLVLTGIMNVVLLEWAGPASLGGAFLTILSVKVLLLVVMAGLQVWMGLAWKGPDLDRLGAARKARVGLAAQLVLGAVATILGMGLRAL